MSNKKISEKKSEIITLVRSKDFADSPQNIQDQLLNMKLGELLEINSSKNEKTTDSKQDKKQKRFYAACYLAVITILLLTFVLIISIIFSPKSTIPNLILTTITTISAFSFGIISSNKKAATN